MPDRAKVTPLRQHTIFISYRRDDTEAVAGRLDDRLSARFGAEAIFRDLRTVRSGERFEERIRGALQSVRVVIVLIGKSWLTVRDEEGRRRLDAPDDLLRTEIEIALAAKGTRVIPVLVAGAVKPARAELPESIRELDKLDYAQLRSGRDFAHDVDDLRDSICAALPRSAYRLWPRVRRPVLLLAALAILSLAAVVGAARGVAWLRAKDAPDWLIERVPSVESPEIRDAGMEPTPVVELPLSVRTRNALAYMEDRYRAAGGEPPSATYRDLLVAGGWIEDRDGSGFPPSGEGLRRWLDEPDRTSEELRAVLLRGHRSKRPPDFFIQADEIVVKMLGTPPDSDDHSPSPSVSPAASARER